jgi:hypothetical protein
LTIAAGADFPGMVLELAAGRRVAAAIGFFRDNLWMTNYETAVFVEDDRVRLKRFAADPITETV